MMRAVVLGLVLSLTGACGGGQGSAIEQGLPPPTKNLSDLKQSKSEVSKEELERMRREAGFKSRDEVAAENAAMFEKGAREYVKTRVKEYRALLKDLRATIDRLEQEAGKWAKAKDPQKAFDAFALKYKEDAAKLSKRYDELTGRGAEGGETQVLLGKAFRSWQDLNGKLAAALAGNPEFTNVLTDIRTALDDAGKKVEEIDKDPNLVANKFYEGKAGEAGKAGEDTPTK